MSLIEGKQPLICAGLQMNPKLTLNIAKAIPHSNRDWADEAAQSNRQLLEFAGCLECTDYMLVITSLAIC